ncbi:TPA: cyclophilin-like fold protein [Salmonella enterica subsp. enterica serovar Warragul]|uniref:cyclophilin-like fold protein n=1 Tax=Salmonella enterica TaxID=28901 RepID=UPI002119A3C4|nr:cyclophilin-like fold protein [Salmonella enterica]
MKKLAFLLMYLMTNMLPAHAENTGLPVGEKQMIIEMKIGQQRYDIALEDNSAAKDLIEQLPMTLTMKELNGNEKFADLPTALTASHISPGTLHEGDVMLYGQKTLVLFYKTFQTSYRYTPIGKVTAPDALQDAVGHADVKIDLRIKKSE